MKASNPPIANSHHHVTSGAPTIFPSKCPMDHPKIHQGASARMHRPSRDTLTGPGVVPSVLLRLDDQWVETDKESYSSVVFFLFSLLEVLSSNSSMFYLETKNKPLIFWWFIAPIYGRIGDGLLLFYYSIIYVCYVCVFAQLQGFSGESPVLQCAVG